MVSLVKATEVTDVAEVKAIVILGLHLAVQAYTKASVKFTVWPRNDLVITLVEVQ